MDAFRLGNWFIYLVMVKGVIHCLLNPTCKRIIPRTYEPLNNIKTELYAGTDLAESVPISSLGNSTGTIGCLLNPTGGFFELIPAPPDLQSR